MVKNNGILKKEIFPITFDRVGPSDYFRWSIMTSQSIPNTRIFTIFVLKNEKKNLMLPLSGYKNQTSEHTPFQVSLT